METISQLNLGYKVIKQCEDHITLEFALISQFGPIAKLKQDIPCLPTLYNSLLEMINHPSYQKEVYRQILYTLPHDDFDITNFLNKEL